MQLMVQHGREILAAFNITGHCLYIEDGVEELNNIYYNAVAHVHPIGDHELGLLISFLIVYFCYFLTTSGFFVFFGLGGSCDGELICIGCDESWKKNGDYYIYDSSVMINPSDVSASGFYISNGSLVVPLYTDAND